MANGSNPWRLDWKTTAAIAISPSMPNPSAVLAQPIRRAMIGRVRAVFNDQARGERPVQRSENALFEPASPVWRVHGDVVTMMVGGVAALLLQMLHPAALAGIWDHSNFRRDMLGRLRRTARFIATTTYADRAEAEAAIARVRRIHDAVRGTLPDGRAYHAADPHLLAWVHATEAISFLDAWQRYGDRPLDRAGRDRYFAEFARVPLALGADPVARDEAATRALVDRYRSELTVDARTREVAALILQPPSSGGLAERSAQRLIGEAAIDLLPGWAARMHGLSASPIGRPLVRTGTRQLAGTLRWAFRTRS
jgi:uncharacterized protein (DUF2236 family)